MEQGRAWFFDLMRRYGFDADRVSRRLAVAAVLVAWGVTWAGLMQQPTYKASAEVLVGWQQGGGQWANLGGSGEQIQTLEYRGEPPTQEIMSAVDSRPVVEEAIYRLGLAMSPAELLDHLTAEQVEGTTFIRISYEDPDPVSAKRVANTVAEVFSAFVSGSSAGDSKISTTVWEEAVVSESPASPHPWRNGLLTLVAGLVLCAVLTHRLPRSLAAGTAQIADGLVEGSKFRAGQVLTVVRTRLAGGPRDALTETEAIKEKALLRALGRRGKLSAVEAALETSLSVDEANRMLHELAVRGHLEMSVEHGRLVYSFWGEHGA